MDKENHRDIKREIREYHSIMDERPNNEIALLCKHFMEENKWAERRQKQIRISIKIFVKN